MAEELKPCPFCGGTDFEILDTGFSMWTVECANQDCQALGPTAYGGEVAAARAWNTRARLMEDLEKVDG